MSGVNEDDFAAQNTVSPLWFRVSRIPTGGFLAIEHAGLVRGEFSELSEAMRFATEEAARRGKKAKIRFDASLALIRAAG